MTHIPPPYTFPSGAVPRVGVGNLGEGNFEHPVPIKTGSDVNYYVADIPDPKRLQPYTAECEDIIEALGMTFAEGCAFKALWRSCAARTLGKIKPGSDNDSVYDAEKIVYYGQRIVAQRKRSMV